MRVFWNLNSTWILGCKNWSVCLTLLFFYFFIGQHFQLLRSCCLFPSPPRANLHSLLLYCKLLSAWIEKKHISLLPAVIDYSRHRCIVYWHLLSFLKLWGAVGQLGLSIFCVQLHVLSLPYRLHVSFSADCHSLWTGHALTNESLEESCGVLCLCRLKSLRPKWKSRRLEQLLANVLQQSLFCLIN